MLDLPVPWKVGKLLEDKISIQSNEEKQRGKVALSTRTEKGRPPCNEGVWSRATHRGRCQEREAEAREVALLRFLFTQQPVASKSTSGRVLCLTVF